MSNVNGVEPLELNENVSYVLIFLEFSSLSGIVSEKNDINLYIYIYIYI